MRSAPSASRVMKQNLIYSSLASIISLGWRYLSGRESFAGISEVFVEEIRNEHFETVLT